MSKKHYVIWKGRKTGVFGVWSEVKTNIDGLSDAQYMGFPSLEEAQQAFESPYTNALMKRSLAKTSQGNTSLSSKTAPSKKYSKTAAPVVSANIQIYCDGACSPNPGKSGTGIAVYEKQSGGTENELTQLWYGLYEAYGTNNTAELHGLIEAFKLAQKYIEQGEKVQILSDSKYSIDCITKWARGWKAKGWTRGKGEEVKNLALVKISFNLYEKLKANLTISHVKAHANIEGNELADRMAVLARSTRESTMVLYRKELNITEILAMTSG